MLASEATSHGATLSEAKLSFWLTAGVFVAPELLELLCGPLFFALMRDIVGGATESGFGAG